MVFKYKHLNWRFIPEVKMSKTACSTGLLP
jgi:hypothetical protein